MLLREECIVLIPMQLQYTAQNDVFTIKTNYFCIKVIADVSAIDAIICVLSPKKRLTLRPNDDARVSATEKRHSNQLEFAEAPKFNIFALM